MNLEQTENLATTVKAAREGDLAAFESLLRFFEGRVFGYVLRIVGNREDAEDITQDIFIKVYKKFGSYDEEQSFKTWLFAIATHAAYDFLRKKRVKPELLIISDPDRSFETADTTDTYIQIETGHDIRAALATLRPAYQSVLTLFYMEGLSVEEVARALGAPIGTVKTHLARARSAIKDVLQGPVEPGNFSNENLYEN